MAEFVHLHCHTEYSLLDGAIRVKDLCTRAKATGMPAAAITDHGNLYGAGYFWLACKEAGLKPIIGCEVYVCHDHLDKESDRARVRHHLVLLAQNRTGYGNLIKLASIGYLEGFHYRPRVDKALLRAHSEGLIALSACIAGEIPRALRREDRDAALALVREYADIYPERFYLELQSNGLKEQELVNNGLLELAEYTGLPCVAPNDCHYLDAGDVEAHDILLCIQTQAKVDDVKRLRFETKELYYKTAEEMQQAFAHVPEALANTLRIAEKCDLDLAFGRHIFPVYDLPEDVTPEEEFRRLAREGLKKRLEKHPERERLDPVPYRERLEQELDVITEMHFADYFLIVQDFINWAKSRNIPVGPGRGSAAGSLVAWALRITNLDPLPYNLLFERFLSTERISLPDIDVDFCERRRPEVIRYVAEKYGEDAVAQITTFGTMKAKAVVRDVGRALGLPLSETDKIAKLVPFELKMTIQKALDAEPELAKLYEQDEQVRRLLDISRRLEGLVRHASTHAAGVVIADKPMIEYLPLYRGKKKEIVTQFDMKIVEKAGLVKFDFLGLRTMTVLQDTLDAIAAGGKTPPDLDNLPLNDAATYELYARGDTDGVFQMESSGMRRYLRMLKPNCFEDLIAMVALYRPGPLDAKIRAEDGVEMTMVDMFIKRKHGELEVKYPLPELEDCLRDTYGVIVYQEQVMEIARIVAGYSLGQADLLRRAMGKKDAKGMDAERSRFMGGADKGGIPGKKADEIFGLMATFVNYGFNKSHSAAYALISYHTAWLKAHFKTEFMAALLTSEIGNQDKLLKYLTSCKEMGIAVLPPSVNRSRAAFSAHEDRVLFGLEGIKNVGSSIHDIVEARDQGGEFSSLLELAQRVFSRKVTKRVFESLIKGGACDCFGVSRAAMLAALDMVAARAQISAKEKMSAQVSLLAVMPVASEAPRGGLGFECPEEKTEEMEEHIRLTLEKEVLGFLLTSNPLLPYRREIDRLGLTPLEETRDMAPKTEICCAGLVTTLKETVTKKGERMAFVQVEDLGAHAEITFFPRDYAGARELLKTGEPLEITARLDDVQDAQGGRDNDEEEEESARVIKLLGKSVRLLSEACAGNDEPVRIDIPESRLDRESVDKLAGILDGRPGPVEVRARVRVENHLCTLLLPRCRVLPGPALEKDLERWRGEA